jgi:hypothetical protein
MSWWDPAARSPMSIPPGRPIESGGGGGGAGDGVQRPEYQTVGRVHLSAGLTTSPELWSPAENTTSFRDGPRIQGVALRDGRALYQSMPSRWPVLLVALGAIALGGAGGAQASCGVVGSPASLGDQLGAAHVLFVGTVIYTSNGNRTARVRVESIWKGPTLPAYVDVHGEAPGCGPGCGSEADHAYSSGQRYLFAPLNDNSPFQDYGECGGLTQPYSADLAAAAPADTRAPYPATPTDQLENAVGQYWWPVTVIAVILLAVVAVMRLRGRKRTMT